MERTMPEETNKPNELELHVMDLEVMRLHDIARTVERIIGRGQLSEDIRHCADRLAELTKRI